MQYISIFSCLSQPYLWTHIHQMLQTCSTKYSEGYTHKYINLFPPPVMSQKWTCYDSMMLSVILSFCNNSRMETFTHIDFQINKSWTILKHRLHMLQNVFDLIFSPVVFSLIKINLNWNIFQGDGWTVPEGRRPLQATEGQRSQGRLHQLCHPADGKIQKGLTWLSFSSMERKKILKWIIRIKAK